MFAKKDSPVQSMERRLDGNRRILIIWPRFLATSTIFYSAIFNPAINN